MRSDSKRIDRLLASPHLELPEWLESRDLGQAKELEAIVIQSVSLEPTLGRVE